MHATAPPFIVDDMLAVLVIALFYTSELHFPFLLVGLALPALLFGLNRLGMRAPLVYGLIRLACYSANPWAWWVSPG